MISTNFQKRAIVTTDPLYQWDMNQSLEVVCDNLTEAPEIHFCNKKSEVALVDKTTLTSYGFRCVIPNELLTEPYDIIAYVYIERNSEGNTVGVINIPINARPKPEDFDLSVRTIRIATTVESIVLTNNNIAEIGISLSLRPEEDITVYLSSTNETITLSEDSLTFTPKNYSATQYVTIGMENEDIVSSVAYLKITSEKAGSKIVILNLKEEVIEYNVDTTIPAGAVVTPLSDWTYLNQAPTRILLQNYNGKDTNIIIPAQFEGIDAPVQISANKLGTTVEYVTFENGVTFYNEKSGNFLSGATALKGISNVPLSTTDLSCDGNTSLKFIDNLQSLVNLTRLVIDNCTSLEQVPDLSSLVNISDGSNMFYNCTALKHCFGLPPNLTSMRNAFFNCPLEYLGSAIPKGVTNMTYAFTGNKLSEFTIEAENVTTFNKTFDKNSVAGPDHFMKFNVRKGSLTASNLLQIYKSASISIAYIDEDITTITAWGDSITSSDSFGAFGSWATGLMTYLPEAFISNMAISNEFTLSTAARQGGNTLFTKDVVTIPAETSPITVGLVDKYGNNVGSKFPLLCDRGNLCKIAKIEGYLSSSGSRITFTRLKAGMEMSIPAGTEVKTFGTLYNNDFTDVMIIYMGTNAGWDKNETLLTQIDDMIAHFGKSKYIVISPCSGNHVRDTTGIQNIQALETLMSEKYGNKYINLREKMIAGVLEFNGLTATEEDTSRMAIGQIPRSVLASASDDTHGNDYFHKYLAKLVYDKLVELNYVTG